MCCLSYACSGAQTPSDVPPAELTFHAAVRGVVVDSNGTPLASVSVGARFSASSPAARQVSVTGGGTTDERGEYQFEIQSSTPKTVEGIADLYVHAVRYGQSGGVLASDSALVTLRLFPVTTTSLSPVEVNPLRLPAH
jgi:hypothetical protein